ncbi:Os10g0436700, partial [Oryza sativa Japonica Group]
HFVLQEAGVQSVSRKSIFSTRENGLPTQDCRHGDNDGDDTCGQRRRRFFPAVAVHRHDHRGAGLSRTQDQRVLQHLESRLPLPPQLLSVQRRRPHLACLSYYPNGCRDSNKDCISIFLALEGIVTEDRRTCWQKLHSACSIDTGTRCCRTPITPNSVTFQHILVVQGGSKTSLGETN